MTDPQRYQSCNPASLHSESSDTLAVRTFPIPEAKTDHVELIQEGLWGHMWPQCFGQGGAGCCISVICRPITCSSCRLQQALSAGPSHLICPIKEALQAFSTPRLQRQGDVQSIHSFQWWHVPHSQPKLDGFHNAARREENGEEKVGKKEEEVEVGGGDARPVIWEKKRS